MYSLGDPTKSDRQNAACAGVVEDAFRDLSRPVRIICPGAGLVGLWCAQDDGLMFAILRDEPEAMFYARAIEPLVSF
jgi:hypothetical protein